MPSRYRYLSKSQVSLAVRLLEEKGYVRKVYRQENKKTACLKICDAAAPVIEDGRRAQERFFAAMPRGFTEKEMDSI